MAAMERPRAAFLMTCHWYLKLLRPRTAELSEPWLRPNSQLVLVCFQRPFHRKHLLLEVWDISSPENFLGISVGLLVPNVLALIR